ncbi:MAG: MFS transporter [Actinocrinis sp.]
MPSVNPPSVTTQARTSATPRTSTSAAIAVDETAAADSSLVVHIEPGTARGRLRRHLPDKVAFYLQASIVVSFLAASSAPTPLYGKYQAAWHFSPITTTVIFGVYALAVLVALLIVGSLSDHVGRKPVLLTAIAIQVVSMIVFSTAGSVSDLMIARIVQGIATGGALGAIGAGLIDLDRAKGTITNAAAPMMGTGSGALLSGLLVQFLPAPTHLIYYVILGAFVLQALGVSRIRETSSRENGALASLRPHFEVPKPARVPLLKAIPVLIAAWALAGFYLAVGPAIVTLVTGSRSLAIGGLSLFVLAGMGAVAILLTRTMDSTRVMVGGTAALLVGVGFTLLGMELGSAAWFYAGVVVAGAGFGGGFQGGIRTVVPLAAPHQRAGLLSTVYVICYLAMGVPAVIGGVLIVHIGLLPAARTYGIAVMVLAAIALAAIARPTREPKTLAAAHKA